MKKTLPITLYFLRGLPYSGLTTRAKKMDAIRISKKDIANLLNTKDEALVMMSMKILVKYFWESNKSVVIDDYNLDKESCKYWKFFAGTHKKPFEIVEIKTSMDECVGRLKNDKKNNRVPEVVNMALEFGKYPKPKMPFVLADLTLLMDQKTASLNEEYLKKLELEAKAGHDVIILSDIPSFRRAEVEEWLVSNRIFVALPVNTILMREDGDSRPWEITKRSLIAKYFPNDNWIK